MGKTSRGIAPERLKAASGARLPQGLRVVLDARQPIAVETAEEAAARPGMAGGAGGIDPQLDRILVTIDANLTHPQDVAGGLALLPQPPARAGMEVGEAGLAGPRQRLGVHVRQHQQRAGGRIDRDRGDQPGGVEPRREAVIVVGGQSLLIDLAPGSLVHRPSIRAGDAPACCTITTAAVENPPPRDIALCSRAVMTETCIAA